ncbi:MAG: hypothetical protein IJ438_05420 [Clostridia bacterium]|nr:hypothetical protein [Clostridia bacterium]
MTCKLTYTAQIKWRIRILWGVIIALLIFIVVVGETGGDSRMMTPLAELMSRILVFGGLIAAGAGIHRSKKLLRNRLLLREQQLRERDERNQYLHRMSGDWVMDAMLILLYGATMTASLYNMDAFHMACGLLFAALALKVGAYLLCAKNIF